MPNAEISSFNVPVVKNGTTVNVTYDFKDSVARSNITVVDSALDDTSENPVQNKVIAAALTGKVDKVTGKGLSTEDYTTEEKTKLRNMTSLAGTIYKHMVKNTDGNYFIGINSGTSVRSKFYFNIGETLESDEALIVTVSDVSGTVYRVLLYQDSGEVHCVSLPSNDFDTTVAYLLIVFVNSTPSKVQVTVVKQSPTQNIYITVQRLKIK